MLLDDLLELAITVVLFVVAGAVKLYLDFTEPNG